MLKRFCLTCFFLVIFGNYLLAQNTEKCSSLKYEEINQIIPNSLSVKKLVGNVIAEDGKIPLVDVCIGLFVEANKKLILVTQSNREGKFKMKKIPNGKYRLVVKHNLNFYCVANIPISNSQFEK